MVWEAKLFSVHEGKNGANRLGIGLYFYILVWVNSVFDAVHSPLCLVPCKFDKILLVDKFIEQNFILKILVLETTSRKIFLNFLFIINDTAIIK